MNKSDFEIQAIVAGVSQKELLDFESAFKSITGYTLDSPFVDDTFLKEKGLSTLVAVKAILVGKLSQSGINKIGDVFEEYCSRIK